MLRTVICAALLLVLAAVTCGSAGASGFEQPAPAVKLTDADFCFGPGNQREGFACNSVCFASPGELDPALIITCPGPPAAITFAASPATVFCGSQSSVSVVVADAKGQAVADNTVVTFTTDGGTVSASASTSGGLTQVLFTVPPKTSGVARIVATVGSVRAEKRIDVGC
jgi:hypothetical protein